MEPFQFPTKIGTLSGTRLDTQKAQSLSITDTHVFSASTVLEVRLGYNRLSQFRRGLIRTDIPRQVGISGTTDNEFNFGWPRVQMTGYDDLGTQSFPTDRGDNTYQVVLGLTHTRGNHNLKTGFNIEQFRSNRLNNSRSLGLYRFGGGFTGDAVADLLLGLPNRAQRRLGDTRNPIRHEAYGFYVQDDWKVMPNLTLNLGLRYELITPFTSTSDRMSNFNPDCVCIEIAGTANVRRDISRPENTDPDIAALLANVTFVDLGVKKVFEGDHNNFAPRFGFAYDVFGTGRTVLKGGVGVFMDMMRLNNGIGLSNNVPFRFTQTFNFNSGDLSFLDLSNPFPAGRGASTLGPVSTQKDWKNAHVEQWNLGFQHELLSNMVLDFSYAGAKGNNLHQTTNINQPRPSPTGSINSRRPIQGFANINQRQSRGPVELPRPAGAHRKAILRRHHVPDVLHLVEIDRQLLRTPDRGGWEHTTGFPELGRQPWCLGFRRHAPDGVQLRLRTAVRSRKTVAGRRPG